jgi:hypothetical protein
MSTARPGLVDREREDRADGDQDEADGMPTPLYARCA